MSRTDRTRGLEDKRWTQTRNAALAARRLQTSPHLGSALLFLPISVSPCNEHDNFLSPRRSSTRSAGSVRYSSSLSVLHEETSTHANLLLQKSV